MEESEEKTHEEKTETNEKPTELKEEAEKVEETEEKPEEKPVEPEVKKPSFFDKIKHIDIYIWMIVVLSILAAIGIYTDIQSISSTTPWTSVVQTIILQLVVSVVVATATDIVIKFLKTKQLKLSKTGIISGLFVASILAEGTSLELVVLAAFLAMILKHLIRYQGRNIFNPTLLSLFIVALAFKVNMSWWASASLQVPELTIGIPVVVLLGLFISWKYKRFSLTLPALAVYFAISLLLQGISNINSETILSVILNNTVYYFVFLMLVEPKSSPVFAKSRVAYGITAAVILALLPLLPLQETFAGTTLYNQVAEIIQANVFLVTILVSNALGRVCEKLIK